MTGHRLGLKVMAIFFALLVINGYGQGIPSLIGDGGDPRPLAIWQMIVGTMALATAVGSWLGLRWAPWSALAYGVITGAMIAALEPLLGLERAARPGLWWGAVATFLVCAAAAWYIRRAIRATTGGL